MLASLLAIGGLTVETALGANALAAAVTAGIAVIATHRRLPDARLLRPRADPPLLKATLRLGFPVYLGNVLQYLNYRIDLILVGALAGLTAVGLYSVSFRLAEMLLLVPNAMGFIQVSRAAADTEMRMRSSSVRLFWAASSLAAVAGLVAAVGAGPGINLVFGDEYAGAVLPLVALLPGIVALAGGGVLANDIAGRGHASYNAVGSATALIATVVLDVILVPLYGALGAAIASSIAYGVSSAVAIVGFMRITHTSRTEFVAELPWWRSLPAVQDWLRRPGSDVR
jgi:O-antigen/teichoic acid export membrane protein